MDNGDKFFNWLINIEKNKAAEKIYKAIVEINEYAQKSNKIHECLWELDDLKKAKLFINILKEDKLFRIRNNLKSNQYMSAFNWFLKYLKYAKKQSGKKSYIFNNKRNYLKDYKPQKSIENNNYMNLSQKIKEVLETAPMIAFSVTQICEYIGSDIQRESVKSVLKKEKWVVESKKGFFRFNAFYELDVYNQNKNYTANSNKLQSISYKYTKSEEYPDTISNNFQIQSSSNNVKSTLTNMEKLIIQSYKYKEYEMILYEKFPRGFRLGASIEIKRFRMFYEELIGGKLTDSDDNVSKTISEIGIDYGDSRVMSPQNAIDNDTLKAILGYIDNSFNLGKSMLYYKAIYDRFQQKLITTNVYNEKILKRVLKYFMKEKYCFKRSFIAINETTETDPVIEIKELLIQKNIPMFCEDIQINIPHIPLSKIKLVLSQNQQFINIERNCYTHIECFDATEMELNEIRLSIRNNILKDGFITRGDLVKVIKIKNPNLIEKNILFTNLGFGNAIAYYFRNDFDCNGSIISEKGVNLNATKIFSSYCADKEQVYLAELETLAKEIGFSTLPSFYLSEVFNEFTRVNQELLVRKNNLSFDVETIDTILDKFCISEYIVISDVNSFALFPSHEYTWNYYLLESYVKNNSVSYKYLSDSTSMSKCIGVVVKKKSLFSEYAQVLIDVLANAPISYLDNNKLALDYLYKRGFIAKRRMSNIDKLIASARIVKEQRG